MASPKYLVNNTVVSRDSVARRAQVAIDDAHEIFRLQVLTEGGEIAQIGKLSRNRPLGRAGIQFAYRADIFQQRLENKVPNKRRCSSCSLRSVKSSITRATPRLMWFSSRSGLATTCQYFCCPSFKALSPYMLHMIVPHHFNIFVENFCDAVQNFAQGQTIASIIVDAGNAFRGLVTDNDAVIAIDSDHSGSIDANMLDSRICISST